MICSKCGEYNDNGAYFCGNCGHKLRTKFSWAIFFAMLFIIAAAPAIVFYNGNGKQRSSENQQSSDSIQTPQPSTIQSPTAEQAKQALEKANVVFQKKLDEKQSEIDRLKEVNQDNLKLVARIKELENEIARLKKQPPITVTREKEVIKEDPKQTRKIEELTKKIKELEKELVNLKNKFL